MSGHPRSATAPSGEFAHRLARLGRSNRDGYANGRVISRTLRSRGGSSVAEPRREDIYADPGGGAVRAGVLGVGGA